jgi:DNA-binding transcriptional ArsR family regulator
MVQHSAPTLDRVFHALAHPARRSILRQLLSGEHNLTALAEPLKMSFPAASKHVRMLERARLVRRRVVGRSHLCRVEPNALARANQWLVDYARAWDERFQHLDTLLEQLNAQSAAPQHPSE